jgi:[ribosomal protein S5]-alanine N-acetyltransferase
MQLETKNYILKTLGTKGATNLYLSWLKDDEISRTLDVDGQSQTLDKIRSFIVSHDDKTSFLFGIFTKNGLHIGTHSFRYYPQHKLATVGVMIGDKSFWGKAVPLETRTGILNWAFDELGCNKVEAGCLSINLPAIYNFKRQNWKIEGIRKEHRIVNNQSVDTILFGMIKKDWYEQR